MFGGKKMAKLVILRNDKPVMDFDIHSGMKIGRRKGNDIHVNSLAVSGIHAEILLEGKTTLIVDQKSTNGTEVNAIKIRKQILHHGDIITIGDQKILFIDEPSNQEQKTMTSSHQSFKKNVIEKPCLQILNGANSGKKLTLANDKTSLGKKGEKYAIISKMPEGHYIKPNKRDIEILLNGKRLNNHLYQLSDTDIIELNGIQMEYCEAKVINNSVARFEWFN